MNAAAKLVNQGALTRNWVLVAFFTRTQFMLSFFLCMVFVTAIGIIYTTHLSRDIEASLHQDQAEYNQLYSQQGQLLLERGSLSVQTRVEKIAEQTLKMIIPDQPMVVTIKE